MNREERRTMMSIARSSTNELRTLNAKLKAGTANVKEIFRARELVKVLLEIRHKNKSAKLAAAVERRLTEYRGGAHGPMRSGELYASSRARQSDPLPHQEPALLGAHQAATTGAGVV